MNTNGSITTESDANAKVNAKIKPNQPDLGQLSQLVSAVMPLAEKYVDFQKSKFNYTVKRDDRAGSHNRKLTSSLLLFLGIVIGIMSFLTFLGKVSGDALLFLVGIVVGYMMNMIQGLLYSPWENNEEEL